MKATRVAEPRTYHQLIERGTGCSTIGMIALEIPSRSSSHR
jgi:hypothetical protein